MHVRRGRARASLPVPPRPLADVDLPPFLRRQVPQHTVSGSTPVHSAPWRKWRSERGALSTEEILRDFYREMLLIRRFEEKVEERFRAGDLAGLPARRDRPGGGRGRRLPGARRGRRHRLHPPRARACAGERDAANAVMAELYGKREGCSHGYGGSMHLYDVERGNLGANAVVGGGCRRSSALRSPSSCADEPRVAVAFFGDGATNIGTFHESLNLAQLWQVPVALRLREQPLGGVDAAVAAPRRSEDLTQRALAVGMRVAHVDGQDVEDVYRDALEALEHVRREGPVFLALRDGAAERPLHRRPAGLPRQGGLRTRRHHDPLDRARPRLGALDEEPEALDAEVHEIVERSSSSRATAPTRSPRTRSSTCMPEPRVPGQPLLPPGGARLRSGLTPLAQCRAGGACPCWDALFLRAACLPPLPATSRGTRGVVTWMPELSYREAVRDALVDAMRAGRRRLHPRRGHRRDGRLDGRDAGDARRVRAGARPQHPDLGDGDRRRRIGPRCRVCARSSRSCTRTS